MSPYQIQDFHEARTLLLLETGICLIEGPEDAVCDHPLLCRRGCRELRHRQHSL